MLPTFEQPEKRHCLAMLVLVSLLWCLEALPLFVTSMLIPLLAVVSSGRSACHLQSHVLPGEQPARVDSLCERLSCTRLLNVHNVLNRRCACACTQLACCLGLCQGRRVCTA